MNEVAIGITSITVIAVLLLDKNEHYIIQRILNWFPAILFAYVIPAIIIHLLDFDMSEIQIHSWSKAFIMPGAIILVMSALSFRQLKIIGYRPIFVFLAGSLTVSIFPILLTLFLKPFSESFFQSNSYRGILEGTSTNSRIMDRRKH